MNKKFESKTVHSLCRTSILFISLATLLLAALKILGYGYFPSDDALRHVAYTVSGKNWSQILLIRSEITMDSHPGWHFILDWAGRFTGYDSTLMLNFSVLVLVMLFTCPMFFMLRRQEAWTLTLLLMTIFSWGTVFRLFYGRPFIFTMFLILVFCFLWSRIRDKKYPVSELIVYTLLTALSTWIHGTWYLLSMPLAALFLSGQYRVLWLMSVSTAVGVLLGAICSGSPVVFLYQMVYHVVSAFGVHDFQRQLVTEFRPFDGAPVLLVLTGLLLIWRKARGEWSMDCVFNPVFILAGIGWIMGFVAGRFWYDWGWPALAFWMAVEFQHAMRTGTRHFEFRRLVWVSVLCLTFFLAVTSDLGSRWSGHVSEWPNMEDVEHRPWLPDDGGILYNDSMGLFYRIFFHNPHGPWRYTLGFEPIWMPKEHLEIYRHIQLTRGRPESYQPWVDMMTDRDRMFLIRNSKPNIDGLDWHEVTPTIWSGRLAPELSEVEFHEKTQVPSSEAGFD